MMAEAVLLVHLGFIVFVLFGGLLALRWRWVPWVHLPAAAWGAAIEFGGWMCPLTPLENWLRRTGGESGFHGGFIEQYLVPLVYPPGLTPQTQVYLGVGVLLINALAYGLVWWKRSKPS